MSPRSAVLWSKLMENSNISAEFQQFQQKLEYLGVESWPICIKPTEQGLFFWASQYESKECYAMIKTDQNIKYLKWVKVIDNGKFCQKSGLDWLQTDNFGHFAGFSIFSPKMRLRLTWNGQFHLIHNFSHLLPPKCLIFWEISKKIIPVLRGNISNFFEFFNFFANHFTLRVAQNDPQWQILPKKWLRLAKNSQFRSFCRFFHLFPQNQAQIDLEWLITWFTTFPIFYHQSVSFLEKSHRFSFHQGEYISKFFEFFNFLKPFHTKLTQNDPQWQILPPEWLGWAQNGQFWLNFNKNLKYLSGILTDLHRIFRTGLVFVSWSKWVQGVLYYNQKWWKL